MLINYPVVLPSASQLQKSSVAPLGAVSHRFIFNFLIQYKYISNSDENISISVVLVIMYDYISIYACNI